MRVLQLSDPHLLADPKGRCRGREALACLLHGWDQALAQLAVPPDLLLISGDLCQDESWGGYVHLRRFVEEVLAPAGIPVALHHPPVLLGGGGWLDDLALKEPERLLAPLLASSRVRGVVFGHVHQHWQGELARPGGGDPLPLWGSPSTLAPFPAVQPCPLAHPDWPGGRLLELGAGGSIRTRLLRWPPLRSD